MRRRLVDRRRWLERGSTVRATRRESLQRCFCAADHGTVLTEIKIARMPTERFRVDPDGDESDLDQAWVAAGRAPPSPRPT